MKLTETTGNWLVIELENGDRVVHQGDKRLPKGATRLAAFVVLTDAGLYLDALKAREQEHIIGTGLNTNDYRLAPSGEGPHAATWKDKPHRLIYDLCREINILQAAGVKASTGRELPAMFGKFLKAHGLRTVVNALGTAIKRAARRQEIIPYSSKDRATVDPCDLETAAGNLLADLY